MKMDRRPRWRVSRRTRGFVLGVLVLVLVAGVHVARVAATRTMCSQCNQYGMWDWEYWYYECYEAPPDDCGIVG